MNPDRQHESTPHQAGKQVKVFICILRILVPLLLPALFAFFVYFPSHIRSQEAITRANLHQIQIAVEQSATGTLGHYTRDINDLIGSPLLPTMPENPFTRKPMRIIRFGEEPFEGECTYLPVTIDDAVEGYYLIGYGSKRTPGIDMDNNGKKDHVVIRLLQEWSYNDVSGIGTAQTIFPSFEQAAEAGPDKDWVVR